MTAETIQAQADRAVANYARRDGTFLAWCAAWSHDLTGRTDASIANLYAFWCDETAGVVR